MRRGATPAYRHGSRYRLPKVISLLFHIPGSRPVCHLPNSIAMQQRFVYIRRESFCTDSSAQSFLAGSGGDDVFIYRLALVQFVIVCF